MNNISTNSTNFSIPEHNDANTSSNFGCSIDEAHFTKYVVTWIIISIGLPLTLVAVIAVYSLIRKDHVAPIYVINLLISDLIQLCSMIHWLLDCHFSRISYYFYRFGLTASIGFMVCVSLERYLVVAWPLWYRFKRTLKIPAVVCVAVWTLPLVYILPHYFTVGEQIKHILIVVLHLFPFPLLIFFLGGTLKALSAARGVPPDEKRQIVATVVVVLLIYTLLFLPRVVWSLNEDSRHNAVFSQLTFILLKLSPLADCTLYIFMRKGAIDKILASLCCCKVENNQQMSSMNTDTMHSVSVM